MSSTAITVGQTGTTGSEVRTQHDVLLDMARPSRAEVIEAILEETRAKGVACEVEAAHELYSLMRRIVKAIRRDPADSYYHLSDSQLNRLHTVMEAIMPDDVNNPAAGSAHELLNRNLLRGSEFSLVHTRDTTRGIEYCAVTVELHSV